MADRTSSSSTTQEAPPGTGRRCDIVGAGRMGTALAEALRAAGMVVRGPHGRGAACEGADIVLLCVPDREIAAAARHLAPGAIVGHVSASADVELLAPHERFVMHPLLAVASAGAVFRGATCAIDAGSPSALRTARDLASALGMRPRRLAREQRALYHAAASAAANFLVTVEGLAETLGERAGIDRSDLEPLVRSTVDNWSRAGARAALTGPVSRGDEQTVTRQRAAVEAAAPEMLPLWDALVSGTRELAARADDSRREPR